MGGLRHLLHEYEAWLGFWVGMPHGELVSTTLESVLFTYAGVADGRLKEVFKGGGAEVMA